MKHIVSHTLLFVLWCLPLLSQIITVTPSSTVHVFPNGVSVPSDYPHVKILAKTNPDSGFIFINNWGGTPYIAILDNNGFPVFYRKMPAYARDFKLQANGNLSYRLADPYYRFYEMDSSYTVTREITAKNGFGTDEHELQILPNGNVLLIALEYKTVDMSKLVAGGKTSATVIGNHVQEIDPAGNVVFEWKCWDHFDITDAIHENLTAQTIDYVHMNAIAVDNDSNIVISSRHLSEITKINRKTGAILWRLGGKHNQFTIVNDPMSGPSYQHDVRALPNGHYTIFDNGNFHSPTVTRVTEYNIDTAAMTATLVWQYRHVPDRYTWWMGNAQRLPNGNTLINWADGSLPKLTEVTQAGMKAMEMDFVNNAHSYRVFRFPWKGKPKAPVLILQQGSDKITLLMNHFDHAPVHTFLLYVDTLPNPVRKIDSTSSSAVELTGFKNGKRYYFRITVKDSTGKESPFSNEESALIKFFAPGENLVINGDFSEGKDPWKLNITAPGSGSSIVTIDGKYFLQIGAGGTQTWHVQLVQEGIPLVNGLKYRFEFDAYATESRSIEVKVAMIASPNTNYSKTGLIGLTTTSKHFSYDFTMTDASDNNARVVFNCGMSAVDVFIDNVSVKQLVPSRVDDDTPAALTGFSVQQNFPNPFNPSTTIRYELPVECNVRLRVYTVLGQMVDELFYGRRQSGWHQEVWNTGFPAGVYFCRIEAVDAHRPENRFEQTVRMVLLK
ncbi:MAG: aryl-sulfate sulfotransferase [Bacteroidota bacterium]